MAADFDELLANVGEFALPPGETIVLLVDDEASIVSTLERFLRRKGYVVLTADTAEAALDVLGTEYLPHVVLTDKNLPEADGLELIRRGKLLAPDAGFILMTGYATIESCIEALELGALGYLQKPFDLNRVLDLVEKAVAKKVEVERQRMLIDGLKKLCKAQ